MWWELGAGLQNSELEPTGGKGSWETRDAPDTRLLQRVHVDQLGRPDKVAAGILPLHLTAHPLRTLALRGSVGAHRHAWKIGQLKRLQCRVMGGGMGVGGGRFASVCVCVRAFMHAYG